MKKRNIFWGSFFILAALLVVLNQMGIFAEISVFKLIITILLIPIIVKSTAHMHFEGILFPLAFILIMYSGTLGIQAFSPWPILGVAFFLSTGLSFIFPNSHHGRRWHNHYNGEVSEDSENNVKINSHFTGTIKYINSQALEQVNITASFGGVKIYLDKARPNSNRVNVNVDASFSGIELYIPKDWNVKNDIDCTIGGIDEKGVKSDIQSDVNVMLTGYMMCGGVSIIYV